MWGEVQVWGRIEGWKWEIQYFWIFTHQQLVFDWQLMHEPPPFTNQSPFTPLPTWDTCDWWNVLVPQAWPELIPFHLPLTKATCLSHPKIYPSTCQRTIKIYKIHQQRLSTKCPRGTLPSNNLDIENHQRCRFSNVWQFSMAVCEWALIPSPQHVCFIPPIRSLFFRGIQYSNT